MAIQESVIVVVASVEVSDEYRVELTQLRKCVDYSPEQAFELANDLVMAAEQARTALERDQEQRVTRMRAVQPRAVDGSVVL